MKKILLFVVLLSVCSAAFAQKKAHWGVEVGYDHSWLAYTAYTDDGISSETIKSGMNGFHVGPTFVYDFLTGYKHIPSISVGVNYQFLASEYPIGYEKNEYKDAVKEATEKYKELGYKNINVGLTMYSHSIQIPVNARYTFRPNDNFGLFVYTGPMLSFYAARYQKMTNTYSIDGKKNGEEGYMSFLSNKETETVWTNGEKQVKDVTDPDNEKISNVFGFYWNVGIGVNFLKHFSASLAFDTCLSNQAFRTKTGTVNYNLSDNYLKFSLGYTF